MWRQVQSNRAPAWAKAPCHGFAADSGSEQDPRREDGLLVSQSRASANLEWPLCKSRGLGVLTWPSSPDLGPRAGSVQMVISGTWGSFRSLVLSPGRSCVCCPPHFGHRLRNAGTHSRSRQRNSICRCRVQAPGVPNHSSALFLVEERKGGWGGEP